MSSVAGDRLTPDEVAVVLFAAVSPPDSLWRIRAAFMSDGTRLAAADFARRVGLLHREGQLVRLSRRGRRYVRRYTTVRLSDL